MKFLKAMAYSHNNNEGSLFVNDKGGNERRPDYRGSILIEGKLYDLAGWKTTAKTTGKVFLSLKATLALREEAQQGAAQYARPQTPAATQAPARQQTPSYAPVMQESDDDLPF